MYFPFFILRDWGKRSAEASYSHCAVLSYLFPVKIFDQRNAQPLLSQSKYEAKKYAP